MIQPMPYAAVQQMLDAGSPRGVREYFKVDSLSELSDEAVDTIVDQAEQLPAPFGQLILAPMGGAVGRSDGDAMALTVKDAPWVYFCLAMWMDPSEDERNIAWARGFHEAMRPFAVGTTLPNFIEPDEGNARLRASYGEEKYARLVALKQRWDPDNVFRLNQNISPTAPERQARAIRAAQRAPLAMASASARDLAGRQRGRGNSCAHAPRDLDRRNQLRAGDGARQALQRRGPQDRPLPPAVGQDGCAGGAEARRSAERRGGPLRGARQRL